MRANSKILWSEGMFLSPHHFQQWEEYQEHILSFRLKSLFSFSWGLSELEINREGLENGHFTILKCSGLFPGGTVFNIPDADEPVPARFFKDALDPSMHTLDVFLALPVKNSTSRNLSIDSEDSAHPARYRKDSIHAVDLNTGENEREILVAKNNLNLLFSGESLGNYDCIQVARLKQESDGTVALDDTYIPPCLHTSCSSVLMHMVRRLSEVLHAKSASLCEDRSQRTTGMVEFSSSDLGNFWLLHTVNSYIPIIDHFIRAPQVHPELLFTSLAQLAGALTTFSPNIQPSDLPGYDHNNLSISFLGMEGIIQDLLKAVVPTGAVQIPLEKESDSKFTASIASDQLLTDSQIFLAAKADLPDNQLIEELPSQAKISSTDKINSLLGLALPGVRLKHRPAPPSPLRVKLGHQYFRFEELEDSESRKHWDAICKSRTLAIRVPGQRFPGLKLELWSIKE
ncbi:MAG: type VI secretion system baseplate subunit TssK [Acidobacteria bacterium]|nr:type VI secretion system baseplate subunit TssK [Acidobacteriota bacterium]